MQGSVVEFSDKFTHRAKRIRMIGDPANQSPDKWSSTVLKYAARCSIT